MTKSQGKPEFTEKLRQALKRTVLRVRGEETSGKLLLMDREADSWCQVWECDRMSPLGHSGMLVRNGHLGNRYKQANLEIDTNCRKVNG